MTSELDDLADSAGSCLVPVSHPSLYDAIGVGYSKVRKADPRIAARIWDALGDAETVLNVGAGTGSYEPANRRVLAVEPSAVMRAQRSPSAAPCINATAEALPFDDHTFDAAMAVLTDHHWPNPIAGLREMKRVANRVVIFQLDNQCLREYWLPRDYVPEYRTLADSRPSIEARASAIGATVTPVLVPWDCDDGFIVTYWRRPEEYLRAEVRRGSSFWSRVGPAVESRAVTALERDLESGRWHDRNRILLKLEEADVCARLLVAAEPTTPPAMRTRSRKSSPCRPAVAPRGTIDSSQKLRDQQKREKGNDQ
jgi:SAM-dependent methyltransferase